MSDSSLPIPENVLAGIHSSLATWDRPAADAKVEAAEKLRKEFIDQYPLSAWPTLPVESYALGQNAAGKTVSWWLEFNTRSIASMSGGASSKHLVFRSSDGTWRFPKSQYSSVEEAWQAIRAGFVEAFQLAGDDKINQIIDIKALYGAPALRTKALYMYFPEKFMPVCSFTHVQHFLQLLGQSADPGWVLGSNVELLRTLRSIPALASLSTQHLGYFLYHWADPRSSTKVVKIAPGELARNWPACLEGGYISVGWDAVGDLAAFSSKEEFRNAFSQAYSDEYRGHESTITRKSNELWTLVTLEPGDKVIANRGTSEILALGTVNDEGYRFRPDLAEFRHTLGVDWDTSVARPIAPVNAWRTTTVSKVSAAQYRELLSGTGTVPDLLPVAVDDIYLDVEQALRRRGQVILYGPPGTSKTYFARRSAVWFLDGGTTDPKASSLFADEHRLAQREVQLSEGRQSAPRVWFMVASPQQWAWEQLFAEQGVDYSFGRLQRNYPDVRAGDLVVGYESTPTKRIVALARVTGEYDPAEDPTKALRLEPVARVKDGLSYDDLKNDPVFANSEPMRFRCQGTLFALTEIEADRMLMRLNENDPQLATHAQPSTPRLTRVTFHPSYTYEDFIEGYRPHPTGQGGLELRLTDGVFKKVCAAAATEPNRPFVVLIDEINRGNIPKIFGELITLLEYDKRGLKVRLPQSGDDFAVPPNVFVIGTMNTADRSIQLIDAALRRRFRFIELMPDSDALDGVEIEGLALGAFLDALNDRIREKVGRERQIGHAMLFQHGKVVSSADEFADVFRHELLPLVQEYLYDNYVDLSDVFGPNVVDPARQRVTSHLEDPATLCAMLAEQFGSGSAS